MEVSEGALVTLEDTIAILRAVWRTEATHLPAFPLWDGTRATAEATDACQIVVALR